MNRRRFLKMAALTGAGLSVPNGLNVLAGAAEAAVRPDLVAGWGRGTWPK